MAQNKILQNSFISNFINKSRNWLETFEGDNFEAGKQQVMDVIKEQIDQNDEINSSNSLMVRLAFEKQLDNQGKPVFDFFECIMVTFLFASTNQLNKLDVDFRFLNEFMDQTSLYDSKTLINQFSNECFQLIQQRLKLASYILVSQNWTQMNQSEFKIFGTKFWTMTRFNLLICQLTQCLRNSANKKKFVDAFLNDNEGGTDGCLTYFSFRKICEEIGFKHDPSIEWLYSDFEKYLDNQGQAFIDIEEVEELLKITGFSLNLEVKLKEKTNLIEKQRMISPKDYELSDLDYFNNCKTILRNQVAALKVANNLYNKCKQDNTRFFDTDFGPTSEDDLDGKIKATYFSEQSIKRGVPHPEDMTWMRPNKFNDEEGFLDDDLPGKFLVNDAGSNDVIQGSVGNCWFIGALSVLATQDDLIRGEGDYFNESTKHAIDEDIWKQASIGVFPPIFHKFSRVGIYVFRFFASMSWHYVIIDERLPTKGGMLVYAKCAQEDELWVPLIEKAYAKLFGCYQSLTSGFIHSGLQDMTAIPCERLDLHDKNGVFYRDPDEFWQYLLDLKRLYSMMGCSRKGEGTEKPVQIDGEDTGIISGHAYGIMDVFELDDPDMENPRKTHRLLRIRNPWGKQEWCQKWSPNSQTDELGKYEKLIQDYINELEDDEKFEINNDQDGTFLINYKNFRNIFNNFYAVVEFDTNWNAIRFTSKWDKDCSGGLPINGTQAEKIKFATNPQYLVEANEDTQFFVSLQQRDGRHGIDGKYCQFPFKERVWTIMLQVFELPPGQEKITQFITPQFKTTPETTNQQSLRFNIQKGKRYIIIPANKLGQEGFYWLTIYFNGLLNQTNIRRIDRSEMYHFDEVHFAKSNDMVITPWMKDWVRDNTIDYVIKKDVNLNIRNSTFYRSYSKHFTEKTESPTKEMLGSSAPPETLQKRRLTNAAKRKKNTKASQANKDQSGIDLSIQDQSFIQEGQSFIQEGSFEQ